MAGYIMDVQLLSRVVKVGEDDDEAADDGEEQGNVRDDLEGELNRIVLWEGVKVLEEGEEFDLCTSSATKILHLNYQ